MLDDFKNPETQEDADDYAELFKLLKPCKVGMEFRYIGKRTGGECVIRIEYWEL